MTTNAVTYETFSVRITAATRQALEALAQANGRTLSQEIRLVLDRHAEAKRKETP